MKREHVGSGYVCEVDRTDQVRWSELLTRFDDATIYQTWSYGAVRWGEQNLSHLVLREDGQVVGAAQLRIVKTPAIGAGIAYIRWGPLWRPRGGKAELGLLRQLARALREEYAERRGLALRVLPNVLSIDPQADDVRGALEAEGIGENRQVAGYRTLVLDLKPSLEELRANLNQKWRNQLNRAEQNQLQALEGTSDDLYESFAAIYNEMYARKHFETSVDIAEFGKIQSGLADPLRMHVIISVSQGQPVAAVLASAIGSTAIYVLGASNQRGRELKATYALHWRMIQRLKERGCCWYDLGGINPEKNPGVHHFKAGLAGRSGRDVRQLGQFDAHGGLASSLLVGCLDQSKSVSAKVKERLGHIRHGLARKGTGKPK